jgi:hypothetical protein
MKSKIWALFVKSRLPWVLTAALVLGVALPEAATASHPDQQIGASWASYQPKGWSAGSVARGTGYLRPGASHRVREVQARLDRLGYQTGKVDGFFGPITDAAVHQYQRESALRVDGIVGPRTLHDLRSRTRRAQGLADRKTSADKPRGGGTVSQETRRDHTTSPVTATTAERNPLTAVWSGRDGATSSPRWWTLVPLLAALLAIALVAAGLLLRILGGLGTASPGRGRRAAAVGATPTAKSPEAEIAVRRPKPRIAAHAGFPVAAEEEQALDSAAIRATPAVAAVTAISSRRRKSWPAESLTSSVGGPNPGQLRIVRRIEQINTARSGRARRPRSVNGATRRFEANGDPGHFSVLGARIHLSHWQQPLQFPDTLLVDLELFVEGHQRRWETGLIEPGSPFRVSLEHLEESVRALVVPDCLPALADAIVEGGLRVWPEQLTRLTFAIEPSIELERVIAERRDVFPIAG